MKSDDLFKILGRTERSRQTRRHFFGRLGTGVGLAALANLLRSEDASVGGKSSALNGAAFHFAPRAKRVIYLFQSGAPSQLETLDYKPGLRQRHKTELPDSVRGGQRLTGMTSGQKEFPIAASQFEFQQYGRSGHAFSELLPYTGAQADQLCVVQSMFTEAINHDPAITLMQTGTQQPGRPSFGSWLSYGLGSANEELPSFVVLISKGSGLPNAQGLLSRLWGSGFVPSNHQGVKLRSQGDPVLYLSNPAGIDRSSRRGMLDGIAQLNQLQQAEFGDPEIAARIAQYEMAFKMQASVPELTDLSSEPDQILDQYGPEVRTPGTFAANCLLARRLAERDVRFIQLYHRGWDQHGNLPNHITKQCRDIDQPCGALIADLKQRGLLDDTLVVWAGEFGRTVYCQGKLTKENYGRDHHPRCFSIWMAGGGIKPGFRYGQTDEFSYNVVRDPVHVHDLQATILHCLGIDHERLSYRFQGRYYRLTDVHGRIVRDLLS
ncbi:DUF1501 domain-containing protein [Verrucomicrobia bacterium]|jgi:hypothetical protein|nr:DUF1501 domain-containing protein [Verrucomicrobiota bacterium]